MAGAPGSGERKAMGQEAEGPGMLPRGFPSQSPGWPGRLPEKPARQTDLRVRIRQLHFSLQTSLIPEHLPRIKHLE